MIELFFDISNWLRARLYDFWGGKMHKHLHQRWPLCPCQVAFTSVHSDGDISLLSIGFIMFKKEYITNNNSQAVIA